MQRIVLAILFFASFGAYAKDDNYFEFGLQSYYNHYSEQVSPPLKIQETGVIIGAILGYYYLPKQLPIFQYVSVEMAYFPTCYEGTTLLGDSVKDHTRNVFLLFEEDIGYTLFFPLSKRISVTPYVGIAYRYWNRSLGGPSPFSEVYSWLNLPMGLRTSLNLIYWVIEIDFSARAMFAGKIDINLSEADPLYQDIETNLGNRFSYKLKAQFHYKMKRQMILSLIPWFEYYAIGRTDNFPIHYNNALIGAGYEPSSYTFRFGFDVRFRFMFY
jgi:hypothetical protein